jgi:hypothetical protein
MDPVKPISEKTKITEDPSVFVDHLRRPVAMAGLGCIYRGAAPPHADLSDPLTVEAGVRKRFVMEPPTPEKKLLDELEVFVREFVENNFTPLSPETDLSLEKWLSETTYPEWRKEELRKEWADYNGVPETKKYTSVEGHPKDEWYEEFKHARGINARVDMFKCFFGPVCKAMEHVVYQHPAFIKHVPVKDRPAYIMKHLWQEGGTYLATDYSSFEALFKSEIMRVCEFVLYDYLCKDLPTGKEIVRTLYNVLTGENHCSFKGFMVRVVARRMSGEMNTSLGNGFSNLMFMLFMCKKVGFLNVVGVVEGDDGLFVGAGRPPTTEDFARLGLIIKLQVHHSLAAASFCGIVFEPGDNVNIRDPLPVIVGFGWGDAKYARSRDRKKAVILRCKALSYAHQYPGCPIVQSLAWAALRTTRHVSHETFRYVSRAKIDGWYRDALLAAIKDEANIVPIEPPVRTRLLVQELYGISVDDQRQIEEFYDNMVTSDVYSTPLLDKYLKSPWVQYWDSYVLHRQPNPDYPDYIWRRMPGWKPEFPTRFNYG